MPLSLSHAISTMPPKKSSLQPASAGLDKVVARSVKKAPPEQAPLLAWPLACGSTVAARTRAVEFADGVLYVEVPDTGWRRELQVLAPRYLATLNRYCADGVTRVEFVVAGRKQSAGVRAPRNSRSKRA
jgi:predicted nucleic acid-binding Zn ribbon protein